MFEMNLRKSVIWPRIGRHTAGLETTETEFMNTVGKYEHAADGSDYWEVYDTGAHQQCGEAV